MKYKPEDCYFAVDNSNADEYIVCLAIKKHWDEFGNLYALDENMFEENTFPQFLVGNSISQGMFDVSDEDFHSLSDVREKMIELGFDYNLEIQALLAEEYTDEEDEDYMEDSLLEDDESFWDIMKPNFTLN